jgi:hypothetical protein
MRLQFHRRGVLGRDIALLLPAAYPRELPKQESYGVGKGTQL